MSLPTGHRRRDHPPPGSTLGNVAVLRQHLPQQRRRSWWTSYTNINNWVAATPSFTITVAYYDPTAGDAHQPATPNSNTLRRVQLQRPTPWQRARRITTTSTSFEARCKILRASSTHLAPWSASAGLPTPSATQCAARTEVAAVYQPAAQTTPSWSVEGRSLPTCTATISPFVYPAASCVTHLACPCDSYLQDLRQRSQLLRWYPAEPLTSASLVPQSADSHRRLSAGLSRAASCASCSCATASEPSPHQRGVHVLGCGELRTSPAPSPSPSPPTSSALAPGARRRRAHPRGPQHPQVCGATLNGVTYNLNPSVRAGHAAPTTPAARSPPNHVVRPCGTVPTHAVLPAARSTRIKSSICSFTPGVCQRDSTEPHQLSPPSPASTTASTVTWSVIPEQRQSLVVQSPPAGQCTATCNGQHRVPRTPSQSIMSTSCVLRGSSGLSVQCQRRQPGSRTTPPPARPSTAAAVRSPSPCTPPSPAPTPSDRITFNAITLAELRVGGPR